jgi:hypothetical protein
VGGGIVAGGGVIGQIEASDLAGDGLHRVAGGAEVDMVVSRPGAVAALWGLLGCVAKAVVKHGLNFMAAGVPVGDILVDSWDSWQADRR